MKKYRVESRSSNEYYYRIDCTEEDLDYYKAIVKFDCLKNGGECYYREFPLGKNKKIYYAKDSKGLTKEEINVVLNKFKKRYFELEKEKLEVQQKN